ncbi:MAG TPA: DUF6527 family protein [Mucilaginibacter sp.]|jgi:hypothetical protein
MKRDKLTPEFVTTMPDKLKEGILYISFKYHTAIHLCACGCGYKTITPFGRSPNSWTLINKPIWIDGQDANLITLTPSIGNFNFPCKSHYFLTENNIQWIGK